MSPKVRSFPGKWHSFSMAYLKETALPDLTDRRNASNLHERDLIWIVRVVPDEIFGAAHAK
jgi:hypothetical protein